MRFNLNQAKMLLESFGEDNETIVIVEEVNKSEKSHSGPGLYAYYEDYPDEGSVFLGEYDD